VFAADLLIGFSVSVAAFSILYAPEEYSTNSSARMRVTAYRGGAAVGTSTAVADPPGTWPSATLSIAVPQGFDSVVVHYDAPPPTGGDYGPIFMADNMWVTGLDRDGDGIPDGTDNCPYLANPDQRDTDLNGRGDACECGDQNGDGRVDVRDIVAINLAIFNPPLVTPLCDANGDGLCNVSDIVAVNIEIFSPGATSTCAAQPVPGP
jgi:thrombospondin type 3 repeat protein